MRTSWWSCLLLLISAFITVAAAPSNPPLIVYGAASLTNALQEIGTHYMRESKHAVKFSFAASSTLARQIEAGAPADIFFSADVDWMDYLQQHHLIKVATRQNLLGNSLVLIAPVSSHTQLKVTAGFALAAALGGGRLAVAATDSVPAGRYARAALKSLGVWNQISDKLVQAENVRMALAYVDRAEAPLGVVYQTDALIDRKVRIVDHFPEGSYPAIMYPVAVTVSARPDAKEFVAYLHSATAIAIFKKYGFTVLN